MKYLLLCFLLVGCSGSSHHYTYTIRFEDMLFVCNDMTSIAAGRYNLHDCTNVISEAHVDNIISVDHIVVKKKDNAESSH